LGIIENYRFVIVPILVLVTAGVGGDPTYSTALSDSLKTSTAFEFDWLVDDWLESDDYVYGTKNHERLADTIITLFSAGIPTDLNQAHASLKASSGTSEEWRDLYIELCAYRRKARMAPYHDFLKKIVFAQKSIDRRQQFVSYKSNYEPSELSLLTVTPNMVCNRETLYDTDGAERDPCVSYDGGKILFAAGRTYHLHELDLSDGSVRQITFDHSESFRCRDLNGIYLPNGNILFSSDRSRVKVPCNGGETMNLYICNSDGEYIRRIGYDQASDFFLTMLPDGRALYTRWGYNDRERWNTFDLFTTNPDGTGQLGYYGTRTCFPQLIACGRPIPGTNPTKVVIVCAGKESNRIEGPMAVVGSHLEDRGDPTDSYEFVGVKEDPDVWCGVNIDKSDMEPYFSYPFENKNASYQPKGAIMYSYPYPLDENTYIVSVRHTFKNHAVCLVFRNGARELLARHPEAHSLQAQSIVPWEKLWGNSKPTAIPPTADYTKETAEVYIQDVYVGEGLEGVERGTARRLRVAALDFRTSNGPKINMGFGNGGSTNENSPSLRGGSWDVKQIIGETEIKEDGSVAFLAPANTPLFFQVLDEKGYLIQSMREWATFMPGEQASCVGCHETRIEIPPTKSPMATVPVPLDEFYGPARGFGFVEEVQPVLDKHCIKCHNGTPHEGKELKDFRGDRYYDISGADWSKSYMALIDYDSSCGRSSGTCTHFPVWEGSLLTYFGFDDPTPVPPPYAIGSGNSKLITMLEENHGDVELSREDLSKITCWIDFAIPHFAKYVKDGDHQSVAEWIGQEQKNIDAFIEAGQVSVSHGRHERTSGITDQKGEVAGSLRAVLRSSRLEFTVPEDMTKVDIALVDVHGRIVAQLIKGRYPAGDHSVAIAGDIIPERRFSAGFYLWVVRLGKMKKAIPFVHFVP